MTASRAFGGAVAGTTAIAVLLGAVRIAVPVDGGLRPDDALPFLITIALLLGSVLARHRAPTLAWLAVIAAGSVATIDLAVAARAARAVMEPAAWRWMTVAIGVSAGWTAGAAVAYASEPRRRIGRWVPVVGAVAVVLLGAVTAWAFAGADTPPAPDSPLGPTGLVTRTFLAVTLGAVLVGLVGDARSPWVRARQRIAAGPVAPAGGRSGSWVAWATAFVEEIAPGGGRARQATLAERARIARDLHADVVPGLRRAVALAEGGEDVDRLAEQLRRTLADVEDIGAAAHAIQLDVGGLVPALEALAERVEATSDVRVTIDVIDSPGEDPGEPPRQVAAAALRVVRLALDNAVRHAPGARVALRVDARADALAVTVTDDGPGLTAEQPDEAARRGRRGLADMAAEAAASGAALEVGAGLGGGTRVWFGWGAIPRA